MIDYLLKDEKMINVLIEKIRTKEAIKSLIIKICVIVIVIFIIFNYIFGLSIVKGINMAPKIADGDLLIYYRVVREFNVEDVITFKFNNKRYNLRIVAIEGQTVNITENGELLVDNHTLEEEIYYKTYKEESSSITYPYVVEKGKVFVLNDYRTNTEDSRRFGTIDIQSIEGKIISLFRERTI